MALLAKLKGFKTYLAAIGLVGLSAYQFSTGQVVEGVHNLFMALTAVGLRGAIADIKA